jgi:hypothetical protein
MKYQLNLNNEPIARFASQHMAMSLARQIGGEVINVATGQPVAADAIADLDRRYDDWLRLMVRKGDTE